MELFDFDTQCHVRPKANTTFQQKHHISLVRNSVRWEVVEDCFAPTEAEHLVVTESIINSSVYQSILDTSGRLLWQLKLGWSWVFNNKKKKKMHRPRHYFLIFYTPFVFYRIQRWPSNGIPTQLSCVIFWIYINWLLSIWEQIPLTMLPQVISQRRLTPWFNSEICTLNQTLRKLEKSWCSTKLKKYHTV